MFLLAGPPGVNEDAPLVDTSLHERSRQNVVAFIDLDEASRHYPCVLKEHVGPYLGEHADPAIDRVE